MSHMTKEQLRDALISHGVDDVPSMAAKKQELIALYREHVSENGIFSSDDDEDEVEEVKKGRGRPRKDSSPTKLKRTPSGKASPKKSPKKGALVVDGVDLNELTDDELFKMLKAEGFKNLGPIVETTRRIYLKKLAESLRQKAGEGENGFDTEEDEVTEVKVMKRSSSRKALTNGLGSYSADETEEEYPEEEVAITKTRRTSSKSSNSSPKKLPSTSTLRKRFEAELDRNKERFSPTPRRSIHSFKVTENSKRTTTKLADGQLVHDYQYERQVEDSDAANASGGITGFVCRCIPKLLMLVIFAIVIYFTLQNYGVLLKSGGSKPVSSSSSGSPAPPPVRDDLGDAPSIGNV